MVRPDIWGFGTSGRQAGRLTGRSFRRWFARLKSVAGTATRCHLAQAAQEEKNLRSLFGLGSIGWFGQKSSCPPRPIIAAFRHSQHKPCAKSSIAQTSCKKGLPWSFNTTRMADNISECKYPLYFNLLHVIRGVLSTKRYKTSLRSKLSGGACQTSSCSSVGEEGRKLGTSSKISDIRIKPNS